MDDNTITIQFTGDTTGFSDSTAQVQEGLQKLAGNIGTVGKEAKKTGEDSGAMFKELEKGMGSAVSGIIKGTETWQQAMANVFQGLEIKFAQTMVNMGLDWAKKQANDLTNFIRNNATMVAVNDEKNASITGSDTAAANASAGTRVAKVIGDIKSDAAAAYSGVFAYMSPVLGPAAAIPAGVAFASVAAMEGLVSLDVGAWNLGSDMVAQLHQGEMVVPQTFAQGIRDGSGLGGGGGDSYTININAIDTQTGAQFLKNNANQIAGIISGQVRNFNSNLPAWKG